MKRLDETAPSTPVDNKLSPQLPGAVDEPPTTNVRAYVATVLAQPEEIRIQGMFRDPNRAFLIVEDDPGCSQKIVTDLRVRRGTQDDQEADPGVISVYTGEEASMAIGSLLQEGGPSKITVILDMEFPSKSGNRVLNLGGRVIAEFIEKVKTWNAAHEDHLVVLEVIMNSTKVETLEYAQRLGAVSFSPKKDTAVEAVADYFKAQSS